MSDSFVQVAPDSTGKLIDNSQITQDGGNVVQRQRINISDPTDPDAHVDVNNRTPLDTEYNLAIRSSTDVLVIVLLQQILAELQEFKNMFYSKL